MPLRLGTISSRLQHAPPPDSDNDEEHMIGPASGGVGVRVWPRPRGAAPFSANPPSKRGTGYDSANRRTNMTQMCGLQTCAPVHGTLRAARRQLPASPPRAGARPPRPANDRSPLTALLRFTRYCTPLPLS
ncbi:hypothetical protein SKAU_G00119550 [Synaphobranchus kaupii]|uniref:Uncharacterized protein n=1 Tax=Synaphobranchus kaupii TaxID=118154 RepID=A0A9Q1J1A3_SYNKA|nr:hypothetical protein SKAU_G00119550 [Synaphobranchus kaupii]